MPRATVTSRQLKNKDSGLDLSVPSYKEVKGLMTSTVHYQVVLVSSLACFKAPSHKETDVVQYSLEKKWSEFEDLRTKVSEAFCGTALPAINKKALIVNDIVLRERRNSLDYLLKFIASVPKLATCAPVLEFLGVDALRAKRFSQGESLEGTAVPSTDEQEDGEAQGPDVNVFDDDADDQADTDLFEGGDNQGDEAIFGGDGGEGVHVSMFEEQDFKRELSEEDEKNFSFIPDAIITKRDVIQVEADEEDHSDLFEIEDNLDQLLTVDVGKKKQPDQQSKSAEPAVSSPPPAATETKPKTPTKPTPPAKPKPGMKPSIPRKPSASSPQDEDSKLDDSPAKPVPAPRPKPAPRTKISKGNRNPSSASEGNPSSPEKDSGNPSNTSSVNNLEQDDIMKYLQDNLSANTDDVDLFS